MMMMMVMMMMTMIPILNHSFILFWIIIFNDDNNYKYKYSLLIIILSYSSSYYYYYYPVQYKDWTGLEEGERGDQSWPVILTTLAWMNPSWLHSTVLSSTYYFYSSWREALWLWTRAPKQHAGSTPGQTPARSHNGHTFVGGPGRCGPLTVRTKNSIIVIRGYFPRVYIIYL